MATETVGKVIRELPAGVFHTLAKVRPMGALQARKQTSGAVAFYWRYSLGTSSERVLIGLYDSAAAPKSLTPTSAGYSVAAATHGAELLAVEHHKHRDEGGRPALVAALNEEKRAAAELKRQAAVNTLQHLLTAYCDHLKELGRRSHSDARGIFRLHVVEAWPKVAAMPAKDVTGEHFADMMRQLIDVGKRRTANKLRSYARAAYATAKAAKSKPSIPIAFKAYGVAANPLEDTVPDERANRPAKRPLVAADLRVYWHLIKALTGFKGALLRLHLLTGGQRIEQLVNLRKDDIGGDSILLYDGKGRPGRDPRRHRVPLNEAALEALTACKPIGVYALSTDGGVTHVAATTLSDWAVETARGTIVDFQAKRVRSGVETLLASAGVSQDIRGRLLSHGVSGVQSASYDDHDYVPEKRQALETLYQLLEQRAAPNVTLIKRSKRA